MKSNPSITCHVKSCAYNCTEDCACGLTNITVGTHEAHPTQEACTDCQSFRMK